MKILIFGGTIEGRKLAEYLSGRPAEVYVCVATGYGKDLLSEAENLHVRAGRLDEAGMEAYLKEVQPDVVVDATHPYAVNVSDNLREAAQKAEIPYLRVKRNEADLSGAEGEAVVVENSQAAVDFLAKTEGKVFLTTGSKELETFVQLPGFEERLIARVLSSAEVVQKCKDLGFPGRHIIAAQGPFGEELNYAMFREYGAAWMVTKNTGDAGGFQAKWDAAERAGVKIVVIGRPAEGAREAFSFEDVIAQLEKRLSGEAPEARDAASAKEASDPVKRGNEAEPEKRRVSLVGIGPGSRELMTCEAVAAIRESDCLIGAQRMLEAFPQEKPFYKAYAKDDILGFIADHPEYQKIAVLLSGDIGYFSGAKGLQEGLRENPGIEVRNLPGIASPVYFLDRLGKSWDDCLFTSVHGQQVNLIDRIRTHKKVAALLGKKDDVATVCRKLGEMGLTGITVTVGSEFSYPEERFESGPAETFTEREFPSLSVVLFENPDPVKETGGFGVSDDAFLRGRVPMTKEEIRCVSLSKLQLNKDSVVYDVGAGTGSVTVEAASYCSDGCVYAIETNEEAVELIRKNAAKFGTDNVHVVAGMAPECMQDLPAPTHVFLGGTKGNLKEIVALVREKNPNARFVMNVITPESLAQALEFGGEIVQLQVSRGRKAGRYHLMTAENPVYIITF